MESLEDILDDYDDELSPSVRDRLEARVGAIIETLKSQINTLTVANKQAVSWERAEWYWGVEDPEYTADGANELLWDALSPGEIMGVAGAIEVGKRWGFFTINEEDEEPVYHWFKTKAEAVAAREALKQDSAEATSVHSCSS